MAKKRPQHGRTVRMDGAKLTDVMNSRGLTVQELAGQTDISVGTIHNLLSEKSVYRATAIAVAEVLGISLDVLLEKSNSRNRTSTVHEYLIADVLTDWQTASNGLRFQICRMRHLELDREARGKRFDLRKLTTEDAQRCRTWIKRHPMICEKLSEQPNIIRNLTAFQDPQESFYWVIDEWIEGQTLQRQLRSGVYDEATARQLMLDIAYGLQALHGQGIIRRELNPASILIRHEDGRAILTEFELAKLIDRGPTVSTNEWPVDPYRAGEADSDDVDLRADIYSWARIGIHAITGTLPTAGKDQSELTKVTLPSSIAEILLRSADVFRNNRPTDFSEIVPVVQEWK